MESTTWYQRIERWEPLILSMVLIAVGISTISRVATDPSTWDWVVFCVWAVAMLFSVGSVIARRRRLGRWLTHTILTPDEVPAADVHAAVDSTENRVTAIKVLRELHPGLNLMAAAGLVNNFMDSKQRP